MSKHTEGDWKFVKALNDYGCQSPEAPILGTIVAGNPEYPFHVAVVVSDLMGAEDNASLLTAAPNLLKTLKGVRDNLIRLAWAENSIMIEGIDKAIAEAEGRS